MKDVLKKLINKLNEKKYSYEQSRCVEDQNVALGLSMAIDEIEKMTEVTNEQED